MKCPTNPISRAKLGFSIDLPLATIEKPLNKQQKQSQKDLSFLRLLSKDVIVLISQVGCLGHSVFLFFRLCCIHSLFHNAPDSFHFSFFVLDFVVWIFFSHLLLLTIVVKQNHFVLHILYLQPFPVKLFPLLRIGAVVNLQPFIVKIL